MIKVKNEYNKLIYLDDEGRIIVIRKPLFYKLSYLLGNKKHNYRFNHCYKCNKKTYDDANYEENYACIACGEIKVDCLKSSGGVY